MSDQERLEVAALLAELDRKLEEANGIRARLKAIVNPSSGKVRKKPERSPRDYRREVLQ